MELEIQAHLVDKVTIDKSYVEVYFYGKDNKLYFTPKIETSEGITISVISLMSLVFPRDIDEFYEFMKKTGVERFSMYNPWTMWPQDVYLQRPDAREKYFMTVLFLKQRALKA